MYQERACASLLAQISFKADKKFVTAGLMTSYAADKTNRLRPANEHIKEDFALEEWGHPGVFFTVSGNCFSTTKYTNDTKTSRC